jgi:hypothetical protein
MITGTEEWHDDGMEHRSRLWLMNTVAVFAIIILIAAIFMMVVTIADEAVDKEWATYQKGARAQQVGVQANANPYDDAWRSNLWLDGWLHAANVVDRTQLEPATTAPTGRQVSK